jgi:hypothetical protein
MSFTSIQSLAACMSGLGATRLYAKELAANDNTKNQIYLGPSFEVLQLLPFGDIFPSPKAPTTVLQAMLKFVWIDEAGEPEPAKHAKLVLYPQYPEIRLSGFVMGCGKAPSPWLDPQRKGRSAGRTLILGVKQNVEIFAHLATPDSELCKSYEEMKDAFGKAGVLTDISALLISEKPADEDAQLVDRLAQVYRKGWIDAKRLVSGGKIFPCNGTNCGGFTLEAELGVEENGDAEPDFLGWEIKQHATPNYLKHGSGPITLFTPEPDGGEYVQGVAEFVEKYGRHTTRENISYFQGIHYAGTAHDATNMRLEIIGFDAAAGKIAKADGRLVLVSPDGVEAASWSFGKILQHWCRKHNKAAYIPAQLDSSTAPAKYRYGKDVKLCRSTDATLLLKAVAEGHVYYDPGIKLDRATSKTHRRSQFRIKYKQISRLYRQTEDTDVTRSENRG